MIEATSLTDVLAARGDPMKACRSKWLKDLASVPEDAAPPLAMSGRHPRAVGSYGAECIAWAKSEMGVTLRWWQALAIMRQLEHDESGALVWREVIESGPRRIGKSVRLRVTALWRIANAERIGERQLAMLVSKDLAVGKEIHRGGWRWAEDRKWKVIRLNGGQEIEAPDESRWLLRADSAVYGYDTGYGQVDESWGVDPQSITDGLEPALLERLWPQLHLTSTAHVKATSLMRRRLTAALRDADQDVLLLLWGAHPDADVSLESTWRAASAHWSEDRLLLIRRKYAAALAGEQEDEFDDPDPVRGWAAQYLNVWPLLMGVGADTLFPNWGDRAVAPREGRPDALGISANRTQSFYSLAAALGDGEGGVYVAPVTRVRSAERADFVARVARIQSEQGCDVAIDPKGRASGLVDDLEDAGVMLKKATADDVVLAADAFFSDYESGALVHPDMPALNEAASSAGWRELLKRRVFSDARGDIDMLEAAALAGRLARKDANILSSFY